MGESGGWDSAFWELGQESSQRSMSGEFAGSVTSFQGFCGGSSEGRAVLKKGRDTKRVASGAAAYEERQDEIKQLKPEGR